ncbi:MAG TPA: aspartyl-phosphate phosphatase Spo0E family protein [Chondromyces sp.]|nr:aspartyl-phosphate phosphatase Spo0E family protein [Chondromyces sp.]
MQEIWNDLSQQINHVRTQMILTGMEKGLGSRETLNYSKELDKLLNKYQLMLMDAKNS